MVAIVFPKKQCKEKVVESKALYKKNETNKGAMTPYSKFEP